MRKVFGVELDGTTTNITIGRTILPILGGSYGDNLQKEKLRNMGEQLIAAITMGTYETEEAKIRMAASVYRAIFLKLVPNGFGNLVVPVIFSFTHPQLGSDNDFLDGCQFTKPAQSLEASGKPQEVELSFMVGQIFWGEDRKTINTFDTSVPIGPSLL